MNQLELRPVLLGGAVAGGVAVAVALVLRLVSSSTSNAGMGAVALIMVGMALGGYVSARPQPEIAFTAGAVAAFGGSLVAQVLSLVVQLARGTDLPNGYLVGGVLILLTSTSFGVLGGYLALRRDRGDHPNPEEAPT